MFVLVFVVFVLVVLVHVVTVSTWKSGLSKTELALGRYRSAARGCIRRRVSRAS